jgi:hypothetical protein
MCQFAMLPQGVLFEDRELESEGANASAIVQTTGTMHGKNSVRPQGPGELVGVSPLRARTYGSEQRSGGAPVEMTARCWFSRNSGTDEEFGDRREVPPFAAIDSLYASDDAPFRSG